MREASIFDASNDIAALTNEVAASGEEIVIHHGAPAARLARARRPATTAERNALLARLARRRDAFAATHPEAREPLAWEAVKAMTDKGEP